MSTQAKNHRVKTIIPCIATKSPTESTKAYRQRKVVRDNQRCQRKRRTIGSNSTILAQNKVANGVNAPHSGKSSGTSNGVNASEEPSGQIGQSLHTHKVTNGINVSQPTAGSRQGQPTVSTQAKNHRVKFDNPGTLPKSPTESTQAKIHQVNESALAGTAKIHRVNADALVKQRRSIGSMNELAEETKIHRVNAATLMGCGRSIRSMRMHLPKRLKAFMLAGRKLSAWDMR